MKFFGLGLNNFTLERRGRNPARPTQPQFAGDALTPETHADLHQTHERAVLLREIDRPSVPVCLAACGYAKLVCQRPLSAATWCWRWIRPPRRRKTTWNWCSNRLRSRPAARTRVGDTEWPVKVRQPPRPRVISAASLGGRLLNRSKTSAPARAG